MRVSTNRNRFALVELILLLVIVGLLAGTGYYIWQSKKTADKSYSAPTGTTTTQPVTDTTALSQVDIERSPAEKTVFSKLPKSLQAVIVDQVSTQFPACVSEGKLVDAEGAVVDPTVRYAPVGAAIMPMGCTDGGAAGLFAKDAKSGTWKFVEATQAFYSCDSVFHNTVPKALLMLTTGGDAQCADAQSGAVLSYDQASSKYFY